MGDENTLSEKIRKHPVVVVLAFIGAAIVGLASFTEALGTITEKARCIPIHL